jgi:hypothetical protein
MDEIELPEAKAQGQTFIADGRTFVVNPYGHAGVPMLGWFEVNPDRTKHEAVIVA